MKNGAHSVSTRPLISASVAFTQPTRACFPVTEDKAEGRKARRHAATEDVCSEDLAKHLHRRDHSGCPWAPDFEVKCQKPYFCESSQIKTGAVFLLLLLFIEFSAASLPSLSVGSISEMYFWIFVV